MNTYSGRRESTKNKQELSKRTKHLIIFRSFDNYSYFGVLRIESSFPVIQNLILFLIQGDLSKFVQVLFVMWHLGQIDRGIMTCEGMITTSRLVEGWACNIIDFSFECEIGVFIFDSIEFAKLFKIEISFDDFFGRRWVEFNFFIGLVNKPQYSYNDDNCHDKPLAHLSIKILELYHPKTI